jgi:hypothetical protein
MRTTLAENQATKSAGFLVAARLSLFRAAFDKEGTNDLK